MDLANFAEKSAAYEQKKRIITTIVVFIEEKLKGQHGELIRYNG